MQWPALFLLCLVAARGSLAAPQQGPNHPPPPPPPGLPHLPPPPPGLPNLPPEQIPAFLKFLRETISRRQAAAAETEAPVFTSPSVELPPAEAAGDVVPSAEAIIELLPIVETPVTVAAVVEPEPVPEVEAEVVLEEPVFLGPRPDAIGLLAKEARPSPVKRFPGPAAEALRSRDRPAAGPPTEADVREATERPHRGYLPPAESGPAETETIIHVTNSYLPPPADGAPFTEPEFSFEFSSPDGLIPPEFLKHFETEAEGAGADSPTSRSTTSTWHTFHTYEFQHTAPGTGPSEPGTGASQAGFGGKPPRKITLELPGGFPDIGSSLLGLAGLGRGNGQPAKGTGNLDQPAPGPDSLIPVDPELAKQIENALNLDALLNNPELNAVENEFRGATPVVSPAKVGEFVPDEVLLRETVEPAHRDAGSANSVTTQRIIDKETNPTAGSSGATSPANGISTGTFGKGFQPSVSAPGASDGSASFSGSSPSFGSHTSSTGSHGSPDTNAFAFRPDGPFGGSFNTNTFGTHTPSANSQQFFGHNSFTTTTQRPFTHTTAPSHGSFGQTGHSNNFHNSFSQTPSTNTHTAFSHTTQAPHTFSTQSPHTFSHSSPSNNFHTSSDSNQSNGHQTSFHQNTPHTNSFTTFSQTAPASNSQGTFGHQPTHSFQSTFTQATTHQRPFTQGFSQTSPSSHSSFTPTTRPATHFSSFTTASSTSHHHVPFSHNTHNTHNTHNSFSQNVPSNTQGSFSHTVPNTNFQAFVSTQAPNTNHGTFRQSGPSRPQATFIQINPPSTFRQTGSSATARPTARPSSSATRLPNFNDPNFDSYAFYSDLRNLYGTPK